MKVCFLLSGLNRGGLEHLALDVLSTSKQKNLDVMCIYRKSNGVLQKEFENTGVPLKYLKLKKRKIINYFRELKKILIQENITIVHAHLPLDALYASIALRKTKIKVVLSVHGYDNESKLYRVINSLALRMVSKNIFVSNTVKKYYEKKYNLNPSKNTVVYNGVNLEKISTNHFKNIRDELNLANDSIIIGMVANFYCTGRDHMTLCRAMKKILQTRSNVFLIFIGKKSDKNPEFYDTCYTYCSNNKLLENVHFLGSRSDVLEILPSFNFFAFSSNHDTFGIAIIEAMLKKVPTIINDLEVFKEITHNGEHSILFNSKDENDFSKKLINAIEQPINETQINAAYEWAINLFSIDTHITNLKKVYQSLSESI
ncbi:MAG: glycosyltransferase family 4 protein [Flavobacteriia bacterium]|nr:glycosyltransferase family 4 protein [Flavobacteriia bacterium]